MEVLYLVVSVVSTILTSLLLSVIVPLRRTRTPPSVSLYQGTVFHERRSPVHHSFHYSVRYALFDLDRAISHTPPGHLSADQARRLTLTNGPVLLLTIPPSVGYEQNPINVYYCYHLVGSHQVLQKCIAEVTNTPWGERVTFVFDPNSDVVVKALHVSPFMDMLGIWNIRTNSPGDNLSLAVYVNHPKHGDHFVATLKAKRVPSSLVSNYALFFWLMPHKVALWIYWHAFKLWWKGVPFVQHPRYANPAYREEALGRDLKLKCCPAFPGERAKQIQVEESLRSNFTPEEEPKSYIAGDNDKFGCPEENGPTYVLKSNCKNRCFSWTDAKWPWS